MLGVDKPHEGALQGAHLIVGPAGSGKTTALVERYVELVRAKETGLLFLVHSRRAARALSERIMREVGASSDQVRVATWHGFALSAVREAFDELGYRAEPRLLAGPDQFALVREMLEAPEEREHWGEHRRHLMLAGFVSELREFVLRAQDALESPESLLERARMARRDDLVEAARFFRRYLDNIDSQSLVDHANLLAQAVTLVQGDTPGARRVKEGTRHLLVDDYQDVTPAQQTLLRELFVPGGSVTVAGNDDARVWGFRGAVPTALTDFRTAFPPVAETVLTDEHRGTPKADAWQFEHLGQEAEAIARECRRLHAREGTPWGEMAVIVRRYGSCARAIRRAFDHGGVPYVVVGENRPLGVEPALKPMLDLARAALNTAERDDLLPSLLASPAVGLDAYEVRALRRAATVAGIQLSTLIANPPADFPDRVRTACITLRALFDEVVACDENRHARPEDVFWLLWERLDYFRDMVARNDDAALDAVTAFARAVERFGERRPGKRFGDYLEVLAGIEFGPEPWRMPEDRRPDAVRILTAHHSVGTEFDAVFVAGAVEGEFPDPRDKRAMLDLRDLLAPASPFERQVVRLEEEKRLFKVATSRARRRLVVTAARESNQRESQTPTPLLHLAGLDWSEPPAHDEPLTAEEAETRARRILRDDAADEAARGGALDLLAKLPGVDPDRWWYEHDWTGPGTPIAPDELRTSYSRLSNYDNCALQYLYSVEMGLDTEKSHAMQVGSWVHDIVDMCARGEIAATEDALLAALDKVWDPAVFESVAIEHRRRLDCQQMLKRWLHMDGRLETLASEVAFEYPIDGAVMRGRIDRVVRLGTSMVRLIDYKTGRNAKRNEEAKEDLQLASYYLALTRVEELSKLGRPKYLELAYLGAFTRDGGFMRGGFDPSHIDGFEQQAQERLEGFVAGIKQEEFAPSPSADCQWCRFKRLCPVWPEGDEVNL